MEEATLVPEILPEQLVFRHLPAFAAFVREHHLIEYIRHQLKNARQLDTPLLKKLGTLTDEQIIEIAIPGNTEFLEAAEENKLSAFLETSMQRWLNDQLQVIGKSQIVAEDITQASFLRKKALHNFLPLYTQDVELMISIVDEIDTFQLHSDTISTSTYINILRESINEHVHFIESVAATSPGMIYVFDLEKKEEIYANDKSAALLGYTHDEYKTMGDNVLALLIHPDDLSRTLTHLAHFEHASDEEVSTIEYRLKHKDGTYRWVRAHESVFKRNKAGQALQIIGIALDVTEELIKTKALERSEGQLLEAQKIADLGNFDWDLITGKIDVSPQLLKVLDLESSGDFRELIKKVHPGDQQKLIAAMDAAYAGGEYECEYRLITREGRERIIWSRGLVTIQNSKPVHFNGTVMDVTEKHHMIQRLQRSEELYKQAQMLSHMGNWTWDLVSNKISWSDELYKIYGLEVGSNTDYDFIAGFNHPDDRETVNRHMQQALADHKPFDFFYRITSRDGIQKILHARGEMLKNNGNPYKLIGTLQDVTERQKLLERLQYSDYLYKQAQSLAHIGNWTWDIASNKVIWTEELYRIFGLSDFNEEVSFERYLSFIHPDDKALLMDHLQKTMQTHEPYDFYHRIILEDGTMKYIQSRGELTLDEHGKPWQMMGTGQDVTRQQMSENALRESTEFIQKIADTTPSLVASYNVNTGQYTFINKALRTILGYDPETVMEKGAAFFHEIIHPDDLSTFLETSKARVEEANANPEENNEKISESKYRMRHKDGSYHWFHTFTTVFDRNEEQQVQHLLTVSIDITEQEKAEQALQQKNRELQQSNASLEEYAYIASHDLKEPLRKIATFSDRLIASNENNLSEAGKVYLGKIIESSRRMQTMVNDLLSISVISGNKSFEACQLLEIFKETLQTLEYKIEEKQAVVVSDDLPVARVIPSQFRQLFQNLIANSLKFTREGVTPKIEVSHRYLYARDVAVYGLSKATKYLRIDISDNGIGFDNQFANKIFAIFQRLHGRTEYEGTGIGLAICKKIAENHGGTIIANGTINKGSTFSIIIPV